MKPTPGAVSCSLRVGIVNLVAQVEAVDKTEHETEFRLDVRAMVLVEGRSSWVLEDIKVTIIDRLNGMIRHDQMMEKMAYDQKAGFREHLTREEMEHVKQQLGEVYDLLREWRLRKALKIPGADRQNSEGWKWLLTQTHIDKELFSEEGLRPGERPAETVKSEKHGCQSAFMECNGSTGRVTGRFVSENVPNLSYRFLSEGEEVLSVQAEGKYHSNLSSSELTALNNLKCDRNIVIKEADKGSVVVVWDRGDYLEEANRQLGDRQVYEEIEVDPTIELGEIVRIPEGAILCTVDVVGLYPSIPHGEGLEAIREALDRRESPKVATDTLVGLSSLVLESNYFEFNDRFYRQKLGTAIGTKFAPAYANLFMTGLEERLLKESVDTHPLLDEIHR
eukprot:gene13862-biopygen3792